MSMPSGLVFTRRNSRVVPRWNSRLRARRQIVAHAVDTAIRRKCLYHGIVSVDGPNTAGWRGVEVFMHADLGWVDRVCVKTGFEQ